MVVKVFKNVNSRDKVKAVWGQELIPAKLNFNHGNVISLVGAGFNMAKNSSGSDVSEHYYTVTEYASNGELFTLVNKANGLNSRLARTLFKQCLAGVDHIHSKGIAHRDIKLENFLLDEKFRVKLADFGLCKRMTNGKLLQTRCGTQSYIAPEILKSIQYFGH